MDSFKKDVFWRILDMGKYTQNKIKYEKKAGYRTINSMILVILKYIWEKVKETCQSTVCIYLCVVKS